jgi:hypothetical protein
MAGRNDAHVLPDHHIVRDVETAKVIESAILIYEGIPPDANFVPHRQYKTEGRWPTWPLIPASRGELS